MVKVCVGLENSFYGQPKPEYVDAWGIRWRYVRNSSGVYAEIAEHPLAGDPGKLERIQAPASGEESQYEPFRLMKMRYGAEKYIIGSSQISVFKAARYLRGMQQLCLDMMLAPDYVHALFDKVMRFPLGAARRYAELG